MAHDVMTLEELGRYLKIPKSTLYKLIRHGNLPGQKVGRQWRFHKAAIDQWLKGPHAPAPPASSARKSTVPVRQHAIQRRAVDRDLILRDPTLAEIVRRLVDAYEPERLYLFGSTARGEAGAHSDYDLLIIVPDNAPPERRRSKLAYERLWGTGGAADVLVWTKSEFDGRTHVATSLPAAVLREGRLLHAA